MNNTSAPFGQPPNTEDDYFVIKGLFRMYGLQSIDPHAGFVLALQPPPGYVFESQVSSIVAGMIFVTLAMIVPTTTRLVLRGRKASVLRFGLDDWTILLAMIVGVGYPITQIVLPLLGAAGLHTWDMSYYQYNVGFIGAMWARSNFYVAVGLTKLSITLFVRRMAYRAGRGWQIFINIFLATVVVYVLLATFWNLFACNPIQAHGDLSVRGRAEPAPVCTDYYLQGRVLAGMHVAQGIILLSTPIIFLWKVRIDRAKKIRLYIIWIVGAIAIAGGILRELRPDPSSDLSWNYTEILVWTSVDLTLELLVASLPVLDGMIASGWHKATAHLTGGTGGMSSSGHGGESGAHNLSNNRGGSSARHKRWPGDGYRQHPTSSEKNMLSSKITTTKQSVGMDRTESRESIVQKTQRQMSDDELEMNILKTQEIRVLYSHKQEHAVSETSISRKDYYLDRPEWRQKAHTPSQGVTETGKMPPVVTRI